MKRKPRSFKAVPEPVDVPSAELARELGLPWKQVGAPRLLLGRREWIALPEFGVGPLHAKTDSGARTSSLHAEQIQVSPDGKSVFFVTCDHYGRRISCEAPLAGSGKVRSSTGVARKRYHIETAAVFPGGFTWRIRLTLANRSDMRCPMLLGRRALAGYFLIDPQGDHLMGPLRDLETQLPGIPRL
jgi:hypothetical protein